MQRLILALAIAMLALTMQARKGEVIMTKQVLPHTPIPERTDEWQFQNLRLDTTGQQFRLLRALVPEMQQVMQSDYEYFVFGLDFLPGIDQTKVTLQGFDPMNLSPANRKLLIAGVVRMGHSYLMVRTNPSSAGLVPQVTKKAGGKTKFVREFEMTTEPIERHETTLEAVWKAGVLTVTRKVVNGTDLLHPAPAPAPEAADSLQMRNIMTTDSIKQQ